MWVFGTSPACKAQSLSSSVYSHHAIPYITSTSSSSQILTRHIDQEQTLAYLAHKLTYRCLKAEEVLIKRGSPLDRTFIVIAGSLRIHDSLPIPAGGGGISSSNSSSREGRNRLSDDGDEDVLVVGDYFGEECVVQIEPSSYSVTATEPTVVMSLDEATLNKVFVMNNSQEIVAEIRIKVSREASSLEDILRYAPSRRAFESYLSTSHALENLHFWLAVDRYEAKATFIYLGQGQGEAIGGQTSQSTRSLLLGSGPSFKRKRMRSSRGASSRSLKQSMGQSNDNNSLSRSIDVGAVPATIEEDAVEPFVNTLKGGAILEDEDEEDEGGHMIVRSQIKRRNSVITSNIIYDLAEEIVRTFIVMEAPSQVNIPGDMRVAIEDSFQRWGSATIAFASTDSSIYNIGSSGNGSIRIGVSSSRSFRCSIGQGQQYQDTSNDQGEQLSDEKYIELFSAAKREVFELMRKDKFQTWRESQEFRAFFDALPHTRGGPRNNSANVYAC